MKTPLRYPGGKAKFAKYFAGILKDKDVQSPIFVEPYCGGAGAAIVLLLSGLVRKIYLNDVDRSIYAFWHSVLHDSERLVRKIQRTPITLDEFDKQKSIQKRKADADLFVLGFSTLFLNRTTFSGIISGGPIGGRRQVSQYKLDCRFNKEDIIERIRNIAKHKKNIRIFNKDAEKFLRLPTMVNLPKEKAIFYIDPPYLQKGVLLYQNNYLIEDHEKIEKFLREYDKDVYVSYDDCKDIREIYAAWDTKKMRVPHCAGQFKVGRELMLCRSGVS